MGQGGWSEEQGGGVLGDLMRKRGGRGVVGRACW